jgi:hypothetical protein
MFMVLTQMAMAAKGIGRFLFSEGSWELGNWY